jgi:hypothetical protein
MAFFIREFVKMTEKIDKRGRLAEEPFSYQPTKDGKVFIFWNGRRVMILKGSAAEKFSAAVARADAGQAQLIMARVTGHFKHGSER